MKGLGIVSLLAVLLVPSCQMIGASGSCPDIIRFLPGECLWTPSLIFGSASVTSNHIMFSFGLKTKDVTMEGYGRKAFDGTRDGRYVPSDDLYASFGENAQIIKSEYDRIFYDFLESDPENSMSNLITVLPNGEMTLIADKEFAGYKPGENLPLSLWHTRGLYLPSYDYVNQFLEIPLDFDYMFSTSFQISLSVGNESWQKVAETVTFELKMPVKVVMYLNWLNDKISDPDAPVPYEEKELYCKFTTDFNLK